MAHLFLFALLALSSSSSLPSIFATHTKGLHLRLTHADSGGPFSPAGRIHRLVQRSHHRRKVLESRLTNSSPTSFDVPVKASKFDYFMEYSMGTPKLPVTGVIDTGSEVVWAKCRPCEQCDGEEGIGIYDPLKSSTFSKLPCSSPLYDYQPLKPFSVPKCQYVYVYGSAIIKGFLATETFSLGTASAAVNLTFGCNKHVMGFSGASGIVGLGQGKLSLISQLNLGRFSYCLTPFNSSSKSHLLLGDLASAKTASSGEMQSTPFLNATDQYYVVMNGISIGGNRLPIPASVFEYSKEGRAGTLFDSGTGQTQLPQLAFDVLQKELQSLVGLPVKDMSKSVGLDLCFNSSSSWPPPPLPDMVFHFDNGADMRMPQTNYMFADQTTRSYCLVMRPGQNGDRLTIIGNYQQQNMHVIYDVASRMLLFKSTPCESF